MVFEHFSYQVFTIIISSQTYVVVIKLDNIVQR